jgi:hypothetical protein
VAATVMGLFGLAAPSESQGRFLGEAFDGMRLPGRAAPARPGLRVRRTRGLRYLRAVGASDVRSTPASLTVGPRR